MEDKNEPYVWSNSFADQCEIIEDMGEKLAFALEANNKLEHRIWELEKQVKSIKMYGVD